MYQVWIAANSQGGRPVGDAPEAAAEVMRITSTVIQAAVLDNLAKRIDALEGATTTYTTVAEE